MSNTLPSSQHAGSLEPELRLVLLGNIGCGKTLSADTLLGMRTSSTSSPSPRLCQLRSGVSEGHRLTIVEAPRLYWSGGHIEEEVRKETERALELSAPGPHAFLLLVPVGEFTEVERKVLSEMEEMFGVGVLDHTLVLLTCGDYLVGRDLGQYLEREEPGLREMINRCGGQYHVINNRQKHDREQVRKLLEKVDNMVQKNKGCYIKTEVDGGAVEMQERERERKRDEQAREREREEQAREKEREEQAKERRREEREKEREREERAKEREREGRAKLREREERVREREREEQAKEREREERAREREREEQAKEREREERGREREREEQAKEREREEPAKERDSQRSELVLEAKRESVLESRATVSTEKRRYWGSRRTETSPDSTAKRIEEMERRIEEETSLMEKREEIAKRRREALVRRTKEAAKRNEAMEERVAVRPRVKSLNTTPEPPAQPQNGDPAVLTRTPSFQLTKEGAILSQLSEGKVEPTQRVVNTLFHRINSFEKKTPTSSSPSSPVFSSVSSYPVFSPVPSSPVFSPVSSYPVFSPVHSSPVVSPVPSSPVVSPVSSSPVFSPVSSSPVVSPVPSSPVVSPVSSSPVVSPVSSSPVVSPVPSSPVVSPVPSSPVVSPLSSPVHAPPVFSPTPSSPVSSSSEMRVVLLGRSGSGKSAAGNLILGREEFVSRPDSPTSITQECQKRKALVAGRLVAMVDTPDWFESDNPPELIRSQLSSCVALSAPGPHAFLLCVPVDQPAYAERRALEALEKVFGPGAIRNRTLVLFTYADRLRRSGKTTGGGVEGVEKYICSQRKDLLELVELCGDRYHVMDRGGRAGAAQGRRSVEELLEKVEQTVREGGGGCHTCTLFQETEDRVRARQKEIMMERRGGDRAAAPRYSSMQPLKEAEEEEALESTREEAERSVSAGDLENLPPLSSTAQASFMSSVWDTVGKTGAETLRNLPSLSSLMPSSSVPSSDEVGNNPSSAPPSSFLRSVWEMVGAVACRIPKLTAGGALLGGVLGVFLGGPTGGAIGATAGSVATEVGRWRFNKNVNPPAEEGLTVGLQEKMDKLLKTE